MSGDDRAELYRRLPRVEADRWWTGLAEASPDGRVLELGAGTGRLTAALRAAGARVTAVERDRAMLAVLRREVLPGGDVEVVEADVIALPDGPRVGLVALPASLLNELPDPDARRAALAGAAARCAEDGQVAIHLLSPWWLVRLAGHAGGRLRPDGGGAEIVVEVAAGTFDPWTARRRATLTYRFADGTVLVDHLDAAVVAPAELVSGLAAAGLVLVDVFGARPPAPPTDDDVSWHVLARPRREGEPDPAVSDPGEHRAAQRRAP